MSNNKENINTPPQKLSNKNKIFGINSIKFFFAMEYILQGLANPFHGCTYQPFFKHLHYDYGLNEAVAQEYFGRSYLAWSFKPIIGFLMDAYGKTKITLIFLLLSGALLYLITPIFDISPGIFFGFMFTISILFACTDVAVDRATVIEGEEEAKQTGRSKSTTVGLNQAICWAAVYGTNILSVIMGGWLADNVKVKNIFFILALVPIAVFLVALRLPPDTAKSIPIKESIKNFWDGLNRGPILWIILFYFLFYFQPGLGTLWLNHLIEDLHFTQTQLGYAAGFTNFGYFIGVFFFAWFIIPLQDKLGLRLLFILFIFLMAFVNLAQFLFVDPWFSYGIFIINKFINVHNNELIRLGYLSFYNFFYGMVGSIVSMSTFSLVGAVIPSNAAGSLFAGFMSIANLGQALSNSCGSWLYSSGLNYGIFRFLEYKLFGITPMPGNHMSINLLIFLGSIAYFLSFIPVRMLPDSHQTLAGEDSNDNMIGHNEYILMGKKYLNIINFLSLITMIIICTLLMFIWMDIIKSLLFSFFITAFFRKVYLDFSYKKFLKSSGNIS